MNRKDDQVEVKEGYDACGYILIVMSYILLVLTFPISIFLAIKVRFGALR